jgi:pimeloyl-ACP methyl ester carboxylesterase
MPRALANGISIEYETFGEAGGSPLLLISGFGSQLISMDEGFCRVLAERGFHAIRFDNRDVGLSSRVQEPYGLDEMAADALGLLDYLGMAAAHVTGLSMGGMIAQLVAINHPEKVLSLVSIMSHLGGEDAVPYDESIAQLWLTPPPAGREAYIEHSLKSQRLNWAGDFDDEIARTRTSRAYDRSFDLAGTARQRKAIQAAPSRRAALGGVGVPTLVIHGDADPLVPVENGVRTAAAIPGAELLVIPGMGHYNPPRAWEQIADAIAQNAARAVAR